MKSKHLILLTFSILFIMACSPNKKTDRDPTDSSKNNIVLHEGFKSYFDSCGVDGSIAIYAYKTQEWIVSDTIGIRVETLPASTFKIINLLIALETKTIVDESEVVNWPDYIDTVKYGNRPDIYHNMSVKEAFELSAGWVFIELSKKIGKDNYKGFLTKCKYGNVDLSEKEADFWNFGKFAISPQNQVEFLRSLYEENLPFSKRNMDIVKNVMITEQTEEYTIRAKTGWTRENNINTGWWMGYIETTDDTYLFSTRLLQDREVNRPDFGSCRKEITKKIFRDLGIIK